jgi:hypothetical protein
MQNSTLSNLLHWSLSTAFQEELSRMEIKITREKTRLRTILQVASHELNKNQHTDQ